MQNCRGARMLMLTGLLALVPVLAPTVATQDRVALAPPPTGTFDFRVLGPDNRPLVDVKPEEVTLKVNGRVRDVQSLQLHRSDSSPDGPAGTARQTHTDLGLADPFGSNYASGPGRTVLIVIDDESFGTGRERTLKPAVANLLDALNHNDRVGLLGIPAGNLNIAPTRQHDRIEAAIATTVGRASHNETTSDNYCRALITLNTLQGIFEGLAGANPTTMAFFSGGMVAPNTEFSIKVGQPGETCELKAKQFQDIGLVAQKVPVDFHVAYIPDDAVAGTGAVNEMLAGLESLAGVTGNSLIMLAGESDRQMASLVDETSVHYVATFEIDPSERKGTAMRVELKVNRAGANPLARQYVVFDKDASGKKGPSVKDLMRVTTASRDLPMRATSFSAREAGSDKLKLVALIEPRDRTTVLTAAGIGIFDSTGKLAAQWTAGAADLKRSPVIASVLVKPGRYRMRVAAIDASGRRGTVDETANVELVPTGTSTLSALVLGSRTENGFGPRLLYGRDDGMAVGYVEVYNVPPTARMAASFELAQTADGPAITSVPATISPASQGDMRALMGTIQISSLPPGDYVVRANVSVDGQSVGRVIRTLRKATQ